MPLTGNQKFAAFKRIAKKITQDVNKDEDHRHAGRQQFNANRLSRTQSADDASYGDASSLDFDDDESGEGSDAEMHRGEKKKGLAYQKTENIFTKIRDLNAQWEVFISRSESPPFVQAIKVSVWFIFALLIFCIWDTFAVAVFEIPHHSWIDYPCFLLCWHFIMLCLAMYGFMLSFLSSGISPLTKTAAASLGTHYFLLFYRIFMEIFFNGFRGQSKLYIERTAKRW